MQVWNPKGKLKRKEKQCKWTEDVHGSYFNGCWCHTIETCVCVCAVYTCSSLIWALTSWFTTDCVRGMSLSRKDVSISSSFKMASTFTPPPEAHGFSWRVRNSSGVNNTKPSLSKMYTINLFANRFRPWIFSVLCQFWVLASKMKVLTDAHCPLRGTHY